MTKKLISHSSVKLGKWVTPQGRRKPDSPMPDPNGNREQRRAAKKAKQRTNQS